MQDLLARMRARHVWIGVAVLMVGALAFWEPDSLDGLLSVAGRLLIIGLSLLLAYQAYDAIRSAITGKQPTASAPEEDPTSFGSRFAGVFLGIIMGCMSLVVLSFAFGLWGRFSGP